MALDTASFETLYESQANRLMAIGYRLMGDRSSAEDLVQEAFLRAFTSDTVITDPGAWLATVVHNGALDRLRRDQRLLPLAEEADEVDVDTAPALTASDPSTTRSRRLGPRIPSGSSGSSLTSSAPSSARHSFCGMPMSLPSKRSPAPSVRP